MSEGVAWLDQARLGSQVGGVSFTVWVGFKDIDGNRLRKKTTIRSKNRNLQNLMIRYPKNRNQWELGGRGWPQWRQTVIFGKPEEHHQSHQTTTDWLWHKGMEIPPHFVTELPVPGVVELSEGDFGMWVLQSTAREVDPTIIKFGELFKIVKWSPV